MEMSWENIKALPIQFWLSLVVTLGSGTTGSAILAQMTQLFGGEISGKVGAITGIVSTIAGVILTVLSTQSSIAKTVAAMPGVAPIQLTADATPALVALGADKSVDKILPPKA
jgi:hypothetical protein